MNSSKKIIKNQGNQVKKKNKRETKERRIKILLYSGIAAIVLVVALVCYEQLKPKLLLTVNDTKLYESDLMYDIYSQEQTGNGMSSIYEQFYGTDYWNSQVDDSGDTGAVVAKETVIKTAEQREVLYQEAIATNYELTDEEKKSVAEQVKTLRDGMTDKQKKMNGLDESSLTKVLEKDVLAARYKQEIIDGFNIDDAAITKGVSKKDYRQYDLQYYYVTTQKTDKEGKTTDLTQAEKDKLKIEMEGILAKAKTAKDFTKLVAEDNASGIKYSTKALLETDTDFISKKECAAIKRMKNNEITGLLTGEDGYYFVKMINNNSSEAYDNAVKEAINKEETTQFNESYSTLVDESYTIEENDAQWNRITMGKVTL